MRAATASSLARIRKELRESREAVVDRLGPKPVAWLALLPMWDETLAERVSFPASSSLEKFLLECEEEALCEREVAGSDDELLWPRIRALAGIAGFVAGSRQRSVMTYIGDRLPELPLADRLEIRIAILESDASRRRSETGSKRPKKALAGRDELLKAALDEAGSLDDGVARSVALARLAVVEESREMADDALGVARNLRDDTIRAQAVARVSDLLAPVRHDDWTQSVAWPDRDWLSPYAAALSDSDSRRRRLAATVLASAGPAAGDALVEAIRSNDRMVQFQVTAALGRVGGDAALRSLLDAARLGDRRLKLQALGAIGQRREPEAVRALIDGLEDEQAAVRAAAARALGESASPDAIEALTSAMRSEAMGHQGRREAATAVLKVGADSSLAREALNTIQVTAADSRSAIASLASIAGLLPEELRKDAVREVLTRAQNADDDEYRIRLLIDVAPAAGRGYARRLVDECNRIADYELRIETLGTIAPHLPERQLEAAIEAILATGASRNFWMPKASRGRIAGLLGGKIDFEEEASQLAAAVRQARDDGLPISQEQRRWADLASRLADQGTAGVGDFLIRRVRDLIGEGRTGTAMEWIAVGESLATVLRGELESAVLLCHRLMEMEYRRQQDERYLEYFVERRAQIEAFDQLVNGDSAAWALHYLGVGGVGKTMLMRHVTARLADEYKLAIARIDFDYLSPDYPARKPGQLLLELGAGLRAYPNVERDYQVLQNRVLELHERLSAEPSTDDPLSNVTSAEFQRIMTPFVSMLERLKQPTLLILDTCEELAKLHPVGGRLPSIEATFEIFRQLHERIPSLRVLFAGRRLLAREGYDWKIDPDTFSSGDKLLPESVEFLRLMEVRGFDRAEALAYLESTRELSLDADLEAAILAGSPELGHTTNLLRGGSSEDATGERYNPFDLALYAEWLSDDPTLTAEDISSGDADPYVEMRIVNRIKHDGVRELIPAAVLLRRFTSGMIRDALDVANEEFDEAFERLGDQEWINLHYDEALKATFLEVDRGLLPRLTRYYEHDDRRAKFESAREQVGPSIVRSVRDNPLGKLSVDHLDAALRVLPPREAGELWDNVTERFGHECDWGWVDAVTQRILGDEGAIGERKHPLRAAVLAARLAAGIHLAPDLEYHSGWRRLKIEAVRDDPDPERRRWLDSRAVAGDIAVAGFAHYLHPGNTLPASWRPWLNGLQDVLADIDVEAEPERLAPGYRNLQLAASAVSALDAIVGDIELEPGELLTPTDREKLWITCAFLERVRATDTTGDLRAFAGDLADRTRRLLGEAVPDELGDLVSPDLAPGHWLDWHSGNLLCRLRFERLRRVHAAVVADNRELLMGWLDDALQNIDSIDAERLVSLILERLHAVGVPDIDIASIEQTASAAGEHFPVSPSHLQVPPLFVALSRAWLARGLASQAMGVLERQLTDTRRKASDRATGREAELAKIEVMQRMRLGHLEPNLVARYRDATDLTDRFAVSPLILLSNPSEELEPPDAQQLEERDAAQLHAGWRIQPALTTDAKRRLLEPFEESARRTDVEGDWLELGHWLFDLVEWSQLASGIDYADIPDIDISDLEIPDRSRADATDIFRLHLRMAVLFDRELDMDWAPQIGPRRMAEVALEEGELLALRLPDAGYRMLSLAQEWFDEADDGVGRTIAFICATMALIRAGRLPAAFERFAGSGEDLEHGYANLQSDDGRGWAWRFWACVLALDPDNGRFTFSEPDFAHKMVQEYAQKGPLPVELEGWHEALVSGTPNPLREGMGDADLPPEADVLKSAGSSIRRVLSSVAFGVIGLGFGITILIFFHRGVGWVIEKAVPGGVGVAWHVAATITALAAIGYAPGLVQRIRSRLVSRSRVDIQYSTSPEGDRIIRKVAVRLAMPQLRPPFVELMSEKTLVAVLDRDPSMKHGPAALAAEGKDIDSVRMLAGQVQYHALPICLHLDDHLATDPVEAAIATAVQGNTESKRRTTVDPFRQPPFARARKDSAGVSAMKSVTVLASSTWTPLAKGVWRRGFDVNVSDAVPYFSGLDVSEVVHLIGNPVQTSSGLYLDIGDSVSFESMTSVATGDASFERGDNLLSADAFAQDDVRLCILQGTPGTEAGTVRTEIYYEQNEELRRFALELMRAGMRQVLVVPALPSAPVTAALKQFTRQVGKELPVPFSRIIKATSALRQKLAAIGESVEWDVCLYTPAPWTSRLSEDGEPTSTPSDNRMEEAR